MDADKNLAARVYVFLTQPDGPYPELQPEWQAARWYHLLWFLLFIVPGILLFLLHVEYSYERMMRKKNLVR